MDSVSAEQGTGSFNALAGYIFGKNEPQEKMSMTTPVISYAASAGRKMSFVMPSRFWLDDNGSSGILNAPKPVDASVVLETGGGGVLGASRLLAVKWFGGYAGKNKIDRESAALIAMVRGDAEYDLVEDGAAPLVMQYNDPFQPPWKRRNEVAVAVVQRKGREEK